MRNFEQQILRQELSRRGGGIEIDLTDFGYEGEKMTAYQNYLGGGLLGRISNDCTIKDWADNEELSEIAEDLRRYMHSLTDPGTEWEGQTFDQNQNMPNSAY